MSVAGAVPHGCAVRTLTTHSDERGCLTEIFRDSWGLGIRPVQWNAALSAPRVLRGVHVHRRHDDYLILIQGRMALGLHDLRRGSPTFGLATRLDLGDAPVGVHIRRGVAHGFYHYEACVHVVGVSHPWDPGDELGCHFADPGLGIDWPDAEPLLSERDAHAPSMAELARALEPWQPF